ncbi:class I SAM-dependent methyltransferase [Amylibacter sp.]|nr:class I SAM-dependent methyltransferase [Amylibacter sp.]
MTSLKINNKCRVCGSSDLVKVFDLGLQALTGVFIPKGQSVNQFNMSLSMCKSCGLTQINEVYDLDLLYGAGYGYESALNSSMVEHLKSKAEMLKNIVSLNDGDIVIDIGSNDATSLSFFGNNLQKIGVDFTGTKFIDNYKKSHSILVPDFFPSKNLDTILNNKKVNLISSYSCFYDLPDPVLFAKEIAKILKDDGVWCLEQSYMPLMLETNSFDTICHEHIEYYRLNDIDNICEFSGLEIKDIEFNDINGGSFSLIVGHKNSEILRKEKVNNILENENSKNWFNEFSEFHTRIEALKKETLKLLSDLKKDGKRVVGIGASTKGNVLLQHYEIDSNLLDSIGEVNKNKYGCTTPGTNIPIVSEDELLKSNPDYLFVLPWHFKEFFTNNKKFKGFRVIFPLPSLEIINL